MKREYIKNIIFTKTPLDSRYQFSDIFQIYPLNLENAPNSKNTDHFPMIIEFWYDLDDLPNVKEFDSSGVNNRISKYTAQTNRLLEITNLLTSITNYQFFFYRKPENYWSIELAENKEEYKELPSVWSASLYSYPEIGKDLKIEKFSTPEFPTIKLVEHSIYYYYEPLESRGKTINFPTTIDNILHEYFQLKSKEYKVANSSIYQICNGIDLHHRMKSLSFFSYVSAIETLVNFEFRNEKIVFECNECKSVKESNRHCKKCGNPIWGVTSKYRDFLCKYVSDEPKARAMYNKIYSIRSKITHTEYLINAENFLNWDFNDKTEQINTKHLEAMQLARRSLSNWLLKRND